MGWTFPVLLLSLLFLSFALGRALKPLHRNRLIRIVFLPGLLIAALLRLLGCYITGAEAKKVSIFSTDSSGLSYDLQEASPLGKLIMATLPFLAMLIFFGITLFGQSSWSPQLEAQDLPVANSLSEELAQLGQILVHSCTDVTRSVTSWMRQHVIEVDLSRLIGFYLIIALLIHLPPQKKESKYAVAGTAIIGSLVWFLFYLANKLKPWLGALQEQKILLLLSRLVAVLALALVISVICVRVPLWVSRLASRERREVPTQL